MASLTAPVAPGNTPGPNTNFGQIPAPQVNVDALANVSLALKRAVDSLAGFAGTPTSRAVTFDDLIKLGIIGANTVASPTAKTSLGTGTVKEILTDGPGITGGPITVIGELAVQWNAGETNALGSHLSLVGGTLNAFGFITTAVTSITFGQGLTASPNPITTVGEVQANWRAPRVDNLGAGLKIQGTTISALGVSNTLLVTGELDANGSPIFMSDGNDQPIVVPLS